MRQFLLSAMMVCAVAARAEVTCVGRPDAGRTDYYPANREPLKPSGLVKLPVGAVKPQGWLKKILEMQAAGFHGHLTEISGFLKKEDNAWLSPGGEGDHGWEEVPYWLKGFISCAYLLDDKRMSDEAQIWIEGALKSQQADGWFGPGKDRTGVATNLKGRDDLWPNMIMLFCIQTYYEHTGDRRAIDLMTKYFRYLTTVPDNNFLTSWAASRGGDQLYIILWLYNKTGDAFLLDLARKTHNSTIRWDQGIANWHNVNLAQGFREPAEFWQLSGNPAHLEATGNNWVNARKLYGQVPGGMFGADENARPGYNGPRQAIETCGIAEEMLSDEILLAVTGEPVWADRCEDTAFNSMPASMTADMKALRYLTSPNQPQSDHVSKSPGVQNGGPMFCMNPHDHRCCQHNSGHAWPYFVEHQWLAAPGNGLAAMLYGPCEVTAQVGNEYHITIEEKTDYPFDDKVVFRLKHLPPCVIPLYFRIPSWCDQPKIAINGEMQEANLAPGRLAKVTREWKSGDVIELSLPAEITTRRWPENRGTVSVQRGPLTYSLQIKEKYVRHGGTDEWPAWDILPESPWNYGLVLSGDPAKDFTLVNAGWPADEVPFRNESAPLKIMAKARRIANWRLENNGCIREVVDGPIRSEAPEETVALIPMGAARLRISAFPVIGQGPGAKDWPEPPKPAFKVKASHCFEGDSTDAVCDGILPKNSHDRSIPRFTWWDHRGTTEWIAAEFPKAREVSSVRILWFDDSSQHGHCKPPHAWRILYREADEWRPVAADTVPGVDRTGVSEVKFDAISTAALKIEAELEDGSSAGILEWIVK